MRYQIKTLTNEDFDSLPYSRARDCRGISDRFLGVAYIRDTGEADFNDEIISHEIEEMETNRFAGDWTHEDKYGIRYGWFKDLTGISSKNIFTTDPFQLQKRTGAWAEKTFMPEGMKTALEKTPIIGDSASRGWLGSTVQQMTNEGRNFSETGKGQFQSKLVNQIIPAIVATYGIGSALGGGNAATAANTAGKGLSYGGGTAAGGTAAGAASWAPTLASGAGTTGSTWGNLIGNSAAINSALSAYNTPSGSSSLSGGGNLNTVGNGGGGGPDTFGQNTLDKFNVGTKANITGDQTAGAPNSWWDKILGRGVGKEGTTGTTTKTGTNWKQTAAGLGVSLLGNMLAPKTSDVPTSRFTTMMEQGGITPRTQIGEQAMAKAQELLAQDPNALSEDYKNAVMADFDKQDEAEIRVLQQNYKALRPYADIENDSAYKKDLMDLKQEQQEYRKNTLAKLEEANKQNNATLLRQDIQTAMGIDEQTFNEYASLANQDLNTIMMNTGLDYGKSQQFKDMFGQIGSQLISSGLGY